MKVGYTRDDRYRAAIAAGLTVVADRAKRPRLLSFRRGVIALVIVHVCLHEIPMLWVAGAALLTYLGLR